MLRNVLVPKTYIASQQETIEEILRASKRSSERAPLRWIFVQQRVQGPRRVAPGPLAELVRRGREATLDQYLLLVAWASGGDHDVHRSSLVWARALGIEADELGSQRVSRNWRLLKEMGLVSTEKKGRQVNARLLLENGSGAPYRAPARNYLGLPFDYWYDQWHIRLDLAAKAMLLIALSLPDRFPLPTEHAPDWYGISRSTADRGLRTLRRNDLLTVVHEPFKSPLAPKGYTTRNVYTLQRPFGPRGYLSGAGDGGAR
jgi:DNA-binding transcriptional ArsR family regulator